MFEKAFKGSVVIPTKFKSDGDLIVGYASTPLVDLGDDKYRDQIPSHLWLKALTTFFATGAEISFMHRNIVAGQTVKIELDANGPLLYTRPTKQYVKMMIAEGDLTGYSIEYTANDWELKDNPDPFDSRPVRVFKDFDVWRVSYVDKPMNPGSTFIGGKSLNFDDFHYTFDTEKGEVTVVANSLDAFAQLTGMFSDGLGFPDELPLVKEISIKMASGDPAHTDKSHRTTNPFTKAIDALVALGAKTQEETVKDTELKAQIEALTASVTEAMEKFTKLELTAAQITELKEQVTALAALMPKAPAEGEKSVVEQVVALGEKVDALSVLMPKAPAEGEKSVTERIAALEASTASTVTDEVSELKATVESIVALLESEKGKSTFTKPVPNVNTDKWGAY